MLSKSKTLEGYKLNSLDGEIGKVSEFYFDDQHWTIRYLVAETGTWLADRQVLISPYALGAVNNEERNIAVDLTKKQIEASPSLDNDKPVSHQFEQAYYGHYLYPMYWVAHTVGEIIPTRCATVNSGKSPSSVRKHHGITICAALTV